MQHNILNDLDGDVFNLFMVVKNDKRAFIEALEAMPIHNDLYQHWRTNIETCPITKALRFIFLSNFGYMGATETLLFGQSNTKKMILDSLSDTQKMISDAMFMNFDFRDVIGRISFRKEEDKRKVLIYADPPYLDTNPKNILESFY